MRILPAPDDSTSRVAVRRETASGRASDVVGHLVAANDEWLVILPEDRGAVWVPRAEAAAIRRVPERMVLPASDGEGLERVLDRTWPGLRRARLGGWVLREGRGVTGRANSVLAVGDPELPFPDAVAAADEWYAAPSVLHAVTGGRAAEAAAGHGFVMRRPTVVLTRPAGEAGDVESGTGGIAGGGVVAGEVVASDRPDGAWLGIAGCGEDRAAEMTSAPARYLRLGQDAVGRVALRSQWAVLSCIEVSPSARGRGRGRAVSRALLAEASRRGARHVALQVEEDNVVARGLYESLGFVEHHRYAYWTRP